MPKKKTNQDSISKEKLAEQEAETMAHHADEASVDASATGMDEEAEKALAVEEGADVDQVVSAEVAAIHSDNESAKAVSKDKPNKSKEKALKTKAEKATTPKKSGRSAKYKQAKEHIEVGKLYSVKEAIELVKKVSLSKFDGAVEIHLRLSAKKSKSNTESTRGQFNLPHGTGKEKKITILNEKIIDEIAKTKKISFDVALASPELMPKVAKIAKILGPRGKMPDPKSGTVTTDPERTIKEINSGKVEYRIDASNNVHQVIGRVSWDSDKLYENSEAILSIFPKSRLLSITIAPSIGPSVAVEIGK